MGFPSGSEVKNLSASAEDTRDTGSILGQGKESVQGAGPGGRPWTGLCCSETPSSIGNRCVSRPLHTPAELGVSAGVLISEGLVAPKGFLVWDLECDA